jgi:hypothetical protein
MFLGLLVTVIGSAVGLTTLANTSGLGSVVYVPAGFVLLAVVVAMLFFAESADGSLHWRIRHRTALRVVGVVAVLVTAVLAVANYRLAQAEQLRARGVLTDVVVVAIDVHSGGNRASFTEYRIGPGDGSVLPGELSGGPYKVGDRLTAYVDPLGKVDPAQPPLPERRLQWLVVWVLLVVDVLALAVLAWAGPRPVRVTALIRVNP